MTQRTHRDTQNTGEYIAHIVAPDIQRAIDHLRRIVAELDGQASGGNGGGRSHGTGEPSRPTEAAALKRWDTMSDLEQLRDDGRALVEVARSFHRTALNILGRNDPEPREVPPMCADGQHGKDAGLWSSNVQCTRFATKAGLCATHYMAWRRHRNGVDDVAS